MVSEETISFWRQIFILTPFLCCAYNAGIIVAYPGVLYDDLLSTNSTEGVTASQEEISWIVASTGIMGTIGFVLLPVIMDSFGRKTVNFVLNGFLFLGWIFIIFADNVMWLVIGRALQGVKIGGVIIGLITVGEYVHPARRGYFNVFKLAAVSFGTITCHIMSGFCTWRQIAVVSLLPSFYAVIAILFWPESPPYLAMKGKFSECEKNYEWLNGKSSKNSRELVELIEVQRVKLRNKEKINKKSKMITFFKSAMSKHLIKPAVIVILLAIVQESSGKHYFAVYIIQIMEEMLGIKNKSLAVYCSLAVDVMTFFAILLSVYLVKIIKRRVLLFSSGAIAVVLITIISFLLLLKSKFNIIINITLLNPVNIIIYCFIVNIGVIPISFALKGEVFPLEFRGLGSCISGFSMSVLYTLVLKYMPVLIANGNIGISFVILGITMLISLVLLYFLLPETKDKTLLDIELEMTNKKIVLVESKPIMCENKI